MDASPPRTHAETGSEGAVVIADGLTKQFGDTKAVDGLDLRIRSGEVFGLVGPDGAGKTTTLRLLAAIVSPTSGRASVLGHDIGADAEAIKPDIGYMAQRFNLYRDLTVAENLDFFADIFGVAGPERDARIARLIRFARLEEFRDRRAEDLSGGMQKKLALACTLVHQPQLLLLDEPTTGVDPVSRREFWEILTGLHLDGFTILVSTPYMDEAERCSRVGLMYRGRLIECDTPAALRGLTRGELLEVRTADLRVAARHLDSQPGVLEVQTYGDRLHVFVDDAQQRRDPLVGALEAEGVRVLGVRPTRPRMEEAFISLIRAREEDR